MTEQEERRVRWEAPRWLRTALLALLAVAVVAALALALRPAAVSVDLATVDRGTVEVAVEEDGRTRVRDRYVVTAPISGTLRRVQWRPGDEVEEGAELVWIDPPEAGLPDPRTRAQLRSRIQAAEAGVERAQSLSDASRAAVVEARQAVRRQEVLLETGGGSPAALEQAEALLEVREAEARSAEFAIRAAEGEVEDLRLALQRPDAGQGESLVLRSPVGGTVLQVERESGGAVTAGEPVLAVGDPSALEVVVDLLSADAVRVPEGAEAEFTGWGGDETLHATVRRVEPGGFTQVSALGIEEQRVNVILDPAGGAAAGEADGEAGGAAGGEAGGAEAGAVIGAEEDAANDQADESGRGGDGRSAAWSRVGDGYRVEARIILDRAADVLRVPAGALFRRGEGWAVFRAEDDRIREVPVEIGRRSQAEAEVLSGLEEGDRVVVYPGDRVEDGVRFEAR